MMTDAAFTTSLLISYLIFTVLVIVHEVLVRKPSLGIIYFPSRILAGQEACEPKERRLVAWLWAVFFTKEEEVVRVAGLDAAVYVRMHMTGILIFSTIACYCVPVLVPLAATSHYYSELDGGATEKRGKTTNTNVVYSNVDRWSMGNIPPKSDRLWAFAVGAWLLTICTIYFLRSAYARVAELRRMSRHEAGQAPEEYAVLLRDIPPKAPPAEKAKEEEKEELKEELKEEEKEELKEELKEEEKEGGVVDGFLSRVHGPRYLGAAVYADLKKPNKTWTELQKVKSKLVHAEAAWKRAQEKEKEAGKEAKRPQHKTGFLGLLGPKVDSIEFCGEKIKELVEKLAEEQKEAEELGRKEGAGAGIAFFASRTAAAAAAQVLHSDDSSAWHVSQAPEPKDLVWENIGIGYFSRVSRSTIVYAIVFLTICFYMIPIAFVSSITTLNNLRKSAPFLKWIIDKPAVTAIIQGFLPQLALIIFLAILPPLLTFLSTMEGIPSRSHILRAASGKFYYFSVFNVFLGVTLTGTLFQTLKQVVDNPSSVVDLLATALPQNATFFITFIALKFLVGFGVELSRVVPLLIFWAKRKFLCSTQQELNDAWAPGPFDYLKLVPNDLLVTTLVLCYSVISPFIVHFGVMYFCFAWAIFKSQALRVYVPEFESHGRMWPHYHDRVLAGLFLSQITMCGYFGIKKFVGTISLFPLPFITIAYYFYARNRFYGSFQNPSMEIASRPLAAGEPEPSIDELKQAYAPDCLLPDDGSVDDGSANVLPGTPVLGEEKAEAKVPGEEEDERAGMTTCV